MSEDQQLQEYFTQFSSPQEWINNIQSVLVSAEEIEEINVKLAKVISDDYKDKVNDGGVLVIGLLKGCVLFFSDIIRKLSFRHTIDFIALSSYQGSKSSGKINLSKDVDDEQVRGKHVLIVEDLIDTGNTLSYIVEHFKAKSAASVKLCVLLNKAERRTADVHVDYVGKDIPDEFVVGYGMDYDEQHRDLPFVGALKRSVYE